MLSLAERNDSWQNMLSGLGTVRDKASHHHLAPNQDLPLEYLEELYQNDDMVARIVDIIPDETLRQGLNIYVNKKAYDHNIFNLTKILHQALIDSRLYGSAFIYLGVDDNSPQEKPLNIQKIKNIRFLNVLSPKDLKIGKSYQDPAHKKYGQPEYFELNNSQKIHESRLIAFYAMRSFDKSRFPPSILQRIYPVLQHFHTAWQATSHLMTDAAQGVFKLKGLHSAMASNKSAELLKRMELVDLSRSVSRSILLDAEEEDFRRDAYAFSGIPQVLEKMMLRLAAASRIPVSLLMGQAPAGMNATGASDIRFFYDQIRSTQEALKPKIARILDIILKGNSENINIEFPALWQQNEIEKAELAHKQAETDRIYLQEGVLLPEEVALTRFPHMANSKERRELITEDQDD